MRTGSEEKKGRRGAAIGVKRVSRLAVLFSHFLTLFFGQGFNVGLPARTPADMPLPHSTQDWSRILVIPCPEAAFFTTTHCVTSNFVSTVAKEDLVIFYGISFHFASTSLKNMSKIEIAVARIVVFILRHSRNSCSKRTAMPGRWFSLIHIPPRDFNPRAP